MLYDPILLPELDPAILALLNAASQVTYRISGTVDQSRSFQLPAGAQSLLFLGGENYALLEPLVDYEVIGSTINILNNQFPTGARYWGIAVRSSLLDNSGASLPSQVGQNGKFLKTDGIQHSWEFATQNSMTPGSNSVAPTVNAVQIALNAIETEVGSAQTNVDQINAALLLKADLVGGKVPAAQLPSYVDDVEEATNFASLPASGEAGKIYVTVDDNQAYRWSGSTYVQISKSALSPYQYLGDQADDNVSRGVIFNNTISTSATGNTFSNGSSGNIVGDGNAYNTYGAQHNQNTYLENSYYNTFGPYHSNNSYGAFHINNRYGYSHTNNLYGQTHQDNVYGSYLSYNTYADSHYSNTYAAVFTNNTLENDHANNRYGTYHSYNQFGYSHNDNTYGNNHNGCSYLSTHNGNTYGGYHYSTYYNPYHGSNRYGENHSYNTYGDSHSNNTYGDSHSNNTYGNSHSNNVYGTNHNANNYSGYHTNNILGNNINSCTFGYGLKDSIIGENCSNIYVDDYCGRLRVYDCYNLYIPPNTVDALYVNNQLVTLTVDGIDVYDVPLDIRTDVVLGTFNSSNELTSTVTTGSLAGMTFSYQTYTYTYMPGDGGGLVWVRNAKQSSSAVGGINASQLEEVRTTARIAQVQYGDYTMQLTDAGGIVPFGTGANFTIPSHADVPLPIGAIVEVAQEGTGPVTVIAASGVILRTSGGYSTNGQWNSLGARQRAMDEWVITNGI